VESKHLQTGDRIELGSGADAGPVIERFMNRATPEPLSQAAIELLSIVAYEQPITCAEISNIKGTDGTWSSRRCSQESCLRVTGVSAAADSRGS
jgi:segregation and condensation protein B